MVHCTLEEWMHIMRLRTSKAADPSMQEIMTSLLAELEKRFSLLFRPIRASLNSGN
jgi:thymidylate synthase (FAD)